MRYFGLTTLSFLSLAANPSSPLVIEGSGSFQENGSLLEIHAADKTVICWENFSIASGETTRFIQPHPNASVLNRVTGPFPSLIDGTLSANGRVILVNPSGVIVGPHGVIQASEFIAATYDILNVKDWSFQDRSSVSDFSGAINIDGIVRATGIAEEGGQIILVAESVVVGGMLQAAQGSVEIESADLTHIHKAGFIDVSKEQASAGQALLWSDKSTVFEGTIFAHGSKQGGDGGFVEVSGNHLFFSGYVDRSAPLGTPGMLVLDPINITITAVGDSANVINPMGGGTYTFSACAPTPANINTTSLGMNLDSGPVTINTNAAGATLCLDAGTISITDPVSWTMPNQLTLIANSNILITRDVSCSAAGPISITAGGSVTIGTAASIMSADVATGGQIDVIAGTGLSVIGGSGGGSAFLRTTLVTSPLNVTVTSGDLLISSMTSADDAAIGDFMTGGFVTLNVLSGSLVLETDNAGKATIGTNNALNISASQNIEFQSTTSGTSTIRCNSSTGNPSTVSAGVDTLVQAFPAMGNCDLNFQNSFLTWTSGQNMSFTNSGTGIVNSTLGLGAVFNIGGNFLNSSMGGGNVSAFSNGNFTMNISGNFTVQNQSTAQSQVFANGLLDLNVGGDVLIENLGATTMLNAVAAGAAGVNINAGGSVILGQDGAIRAIGGDILVIANQDISMGPNSAIDSLFAPGITGITLVVDNQAPAAPTIGSGRFLMDQTAEISSVAMVPVQIFTARQSQNNISGSINGAMFSQGPFDVDTPTEHWGVYYPDSFIGPLYTIFYKEGADLTPEALTAILNVSTQSNAVTFDLLEEFSTPLPPYDDRFCLYYKEYQPPLIRSMIPKHNADFEDKQCLWILVDNYRKDYPSLSRWGLMPSFLNSSKSQEVR